LLRDPSLGIVLCFPDRIAFFPVGRTAISFQSFNAAKDVGGFLIFNACAIALLCLKIVVPPLLDGSVFPAELSITPR
jgi:hypothetical protein